MTRTRHRRIWTAGMENTERILGMLENPEILKNQDAEMPK
jgi:hypothetical protein